MAMKTILLFIFISFSFSALAGVIEDNFKNKNYKAVADYYSSHRKGNFNKRQYIMISYALRKVGRFREDISHNVRFIKKYYPKQHIQLLKDVRESNSIDPDEYPKSLKIIYWILLDDYQNLLTSYQEKSPALDKDYRHFQIFSKLLEGLEFRESKVDKINTAALSHFAWLEDKIYHLTGSLFLNYVSWQREVLLKGGSREIDLQVTNRGYCAGGDVGWVNYRWHFYMDGCVLFGSGGVTNTEQPPEYQQSNVRAFGIKGGPGASMIVSSSKSRIGIKLPLLYTIQSFQNPPTGSNLTIEETNPFSAMVSLYSRWQFTKWYLNTEMGKYVQTDDFFWGLGLGKQF